MTKSTRQAIEEKNSHSFISLISSLLIVNQSLLLLISVEAEFVQAYLKVHFHNPNKKTHVNNSELLLLYASVIRLQENFNDCERLLQKKIELVSRLKKLTSKKKIPISPLENLQESEESLLNSTYVLTHFSLLFQQKGKLKLTTRDNKLAAESLFVNSLNIISNKIQLLLQKKNLYASNLNCKNKTAFPLILENNIKMLSILEILDNATEFVPYSNEFNKMQTISTLDYLKTLFLSKTVTS